MKQIMLGTKTKYGDVILIGKDHDGEYFMVMDEDRNIKRIKAEELNENQE